VDILCFGAILLQFHVVVNDACGCLWRRFSGRSSTGLRWDRWTMWFISTCIAFLLHSILDELSNFLLQLDCQLDFRRWTFDQWLKRHLLIYWFIPPFSFLLFAGQVFRWLSRPKLLAYKYSMPIVYGILSLNFEFCSLRASCMIFSFLFLHSCPWERHLKIYAGTIPASSLPPAPMRSFMMLPPYGGCLHCASLK